MSSQQQVVKSEGKKVVEKGTQTDKLDTLSKKINKSKFTKDKVGRIVAISHPDENDPSQKYITQYHTKVTYLDKEGKRRVKSIYFGARDAAYYCDLKNEEKRDIQNRRLKDGSEDIFHKNFWITNYLNGASQSKEENFQAIKRKYIN